MKIHDSIKYSLKIMKANKGRTFFTVLGILIGIATVIVVYSAGEGIKGLMMNQIESFGTDIIETEIKVPTKKSGAQGDSEASNAMVLGAQITTLTIEDMEAINKIKNIKGSYAGIISQEQVGYGGDIRRAYIMGTSASYIDIDKSKVAQGRFFTEAEDKSLALVVVLGSKTKEKLFGNSDAIGKMVSMRGKKFEVVGVLEERGTVMFMDFDNYVYVPVRTLQKKVMGIKHTTYLIHKLIDVNKAMETADEIKALMKERHNATDPGKEDFRITTMEESIKMLDTIMGAVTLLLLAIVIISLIVGGVGILNVMYVLVTERTMEIGLRKAVGAKEKDILIQFLVDAIMITFVGGVLGVILGVLLSYLVFVVAAKYFGLAWEFIIPFKAYIVSLSFSFVFGIIFGVYPARKAAKLDPIESLRSE